MVKKIVEITNVYGQKENVTLHFNLTRMEIYELQKKYKEGYQEHVQNTLDEKNQDKMLNVFTELVKQAYCEIDDGGNVIKSADLLNKFEHSEAYSELMFNLLNKDDSKEAEAFFKAIMPPQIQQELNKQNGNVTQMPQNQNKAPYVPQNNHH